MKYKINLYHVLSILQILVGVGAIPTGLAFVMDPTGHKSGASLDMLSDSLFVDFYFPGLFIIVFLGIGSFAGAVVSFMKLEVSGVLGLALGILMIVLIIIQIRWIGYGSIFQPIYILIGLAESVAGYIILIRVLRGINPRQFSR